MLAGRVLAPELQDQVLRFVRRFLAGDAERPAIAFQVAVPVGRNGADRAIFENGAQIDIGLNGKLLGRQLDVVGQLETNLRPTRRDDRGLAFVERNLGYLIGGRLVFHRGDALALFGDERLGKDLFLARRRSPKSQLECLVNAQLVGCIVLVQDVAKSLGLLQHHRRIDHQQRLRRRGRGIALSGANEAIGQIEDFQQRILGVAQYLEIYTSPWLFQFDARPSLTQIELAVNRQNGVADLLGFEPARRHPP